MKLILKASQVKIGIKIEKEHKDIYDYYNKLLKKNGIKNPLTINEFARVVANAHIDEIKDYYDRLLDMEKEADSEKKKKKTPTIEDAKKYLKKHPNPKDEEGLHKYTKKHGFDNHKFEEMVYKLATKEAKK